jgi:DNA-binding ferritin-like protein (Dps family)
MSDVKKMIKKNYELSRKLTPKNDEIYTDIVCYLRTSALDELEAEGIIQEIIGMFLEAQQRGEEIEKVIGDDYQAFCDSIIESAQPKKFTWKKTFGNLEFVIFLIGLLWVIDLAINYLPQMIKNGRLILDYKVSLVFLINTAIIVIAATLLVDYIGKNSFKLTEEKNKKKPKWYKWLFGAACGGVVALLVLISLKLGPYILFSVKIYYLAAVLVVLYFLLKVINKNFAKLQ